MFGAGNVALDTHSTRRVVSAAGNGRLAAAARDRAEHDNRDSTAALRKWLVAFGRPQGFTAWLILPAKLSEAGAASNGIKSTIRCRHLCTTFQGDGLQNAGV